MTSTDQRSRSTELIPTSSLQGQSGVCRLEPAGSFAHKHNVEVLSGHFVDGQDGFKDGVPCTLLRDSECVKEKTFISSVPIKTKYSNLGKMWISEINSRKGLKITT